MLWDSPPPPPPPPFPPPLKTVQFGESGHRASTPSLPLSPSILIIASIIAFVIVASASIHLLLRLLSCYSSSPSSSPSFIHRLSSSSSASTSTAPSSSSDHDPKIVIDSLPLFSLASSLASAPKSSLDCAVCLSPFHPDDQLRLLPACRHAFHSSCIDTWLRSTASCPLCRCSVLLPPPPAPPPLQTAPPPQQSAAPPQTALQPPPPPPDPSRSGSFRIEIGSVSRRRTPSEEDPPPHVRTYSLGSSFEYLVDEEVEAVLARVRRQEGAKEAEGAGPTPPGAEVAEAAWGGGRNWLKDYVDRLASSASSSFSSLRFSGRWSRRYDGSAGSGGESWDLEGNQHLVEEDSAFSAFYRWLAGV